MIVGVPKETLPGERRVALTPTVLSPLTRADVKIHVESGAGVEAGYPDAAFEKVGAVIVPDRAKLFAEADVITQVNLYSNNPEAGRDDLALMREGQVLIGAADPLGGTAQVQELAATKATAFGLELVPRITRAQSMDILSSMATVAGYKAVLLAATRLPRFFPMFMTAAGTIQAAKVFVIGAGVAGLQAIATAKRLGATVRAYDVRPVVKDQVQSVGGTFVELELETNAAEDAGGYAKAQDERFYEKQRELMAKEVAASDVVITTAAIPGRKAPILITADAARGMSPGSVIVDLAAERGGNCELSQAGVDVVDSGVLILGPVNLATTMPFHASQMYSKNVVTFLMHLIKDGAVQLDMSDEITTGTLMCKDGEVVHPRLRDILGLAAPAAEGEAAS
ncbi:Re/Si-specific NAD(P)(+) transhydrogenase subunit alpha [Haliangium ochraceum]|uniref:proton-translocating NAD(P)(+) transhydrogenase n=1 Tax=Haliangium ochraceum (strain DSM 14365 / JCM 11303 / SMP-2) TaxID=502025 RepID=D0LYY7_HALO1|nr:Re/Si-specific NAD(P)(+) transhydrogenase subunit alpha [Haliangium ochraceum]ACY14457.1 alanine dehydrogenase/PNT domain protein [Haliangium ochraceum DSM 14365]